MGNHHSHEHGHSHSNKDLPTSADNSADVKAIDRPDAISSKFSVAGMDCADEIAAIRGALSEPDVLSINANLMAATVEVKHLPSISSDSIAKKIESTGVKIIKGDEDKSSLVDRKKLLYVGSSGLLLAAGFLLEWVFKIKEPYTPVLFALAVLLSGILVFPKAFRAIKQLQLDMNVLMTVAVIGAFLIKEYAEAATVVFLFSLSELLEAYSVTRARKAIRNVLNLTPQMALRIGSGSNTEQVRIEEIKVGERVLVKAGDRIPMDGTVISGTSLVNQAPLTGESVPVEKVKGNVVYAGTINESGTLEIEVTKAFEDSKVSQIIKLVEEAQQNKAPSERFVDNFAKIYTPVVFGIAILTFLIPPLFMGAAWNEWLYRALVLLVIACPCALVISTPVSIVSGLTAMARNGVLIKGGVFLEALGKLKAIALDKTGTITEGKPRVQKVFSINHFSETEILEIAASIEVLSSHPLANAVVAYAREKNIKIKTATDFKAVVGRGGEAKIEGHEYFLGNHRFAHELGVCTPELEKLLSDLEVKAASVIVVGHRPHSNCTGEVFGVISLGDTIRQNAKKSVEDLHKAGLEKVIMLSGDNQKTASAIASQAGVDEAAGDLLPDDKVKKIKELIGKYGQVAMIGDGINDAPALAQATVGIAMGGIGTDTAIETSDVTLMQDNLEQVAKAISMGKRTVSIIRFNISFSIAIKAVFLVMALVGFSNLWLAVLADTGASILVIANSLRLLGNKFSE